MQEPTRCPKWCTTDFRHQLNHSRTVHHAVVHDGNRVMVGLQQFGDDQPEVSLHLIDSRDDIAGEGVTARQAALLSRMLTAMGPGDVQAFADRLGAAAALLDDTSEAGGQ